MLARLKISARLRAAFTALIALAVAMVVIGLTRLHAVSANPALIRSAGVPRVEKVIDIADDVDLIARELRNALLWDDAAKVPTVTAAAASAASAKTGTDGYGRGLDPLQGSGHATKCNKTAAAA